MNISRLVNQFYLHSHSPSSCSPQRSSFFRGSRWFFTETHSRLKYPFLIHYLLICQLNCFHQFLAQYFPQLFWSCSFINSFCLILLRWFFVLNTNTHPYHSLLDSWIEFEKDSFDKSQREKTLLINLKYFTFEKSFFSFYTKNRTLIELLLIFNDFFFYHFLFESFGFIHNMLFKRVVLWLKAMMQRVT